MHAKVRVRTRMTTFLAISGKNDPLVLSPLLL
jgi:hypothetical protein